MNMLLDNTIFALQKSGKDGLLTAESGGIILNF
jgi:hypothetical protein